MIVLGLVLILVAAGSVVFALASSSNYSTQIPLHGIGLSFTATPLAIYLAGAVSVILLGLGFALIFRGTGRGWGRHKEHKELKQLRKKSATAPTGTANDDTAKSADDNTSNGSDNSTEVLPERHRDAE
jgi:hypothetical protein